jgi:hypothetical protein
MQADAAQDAAQSQADAMRANAAMAQEQAQPWSVGSLGGTAEFDSDTQTALLNLSPDLSNIYSGALDRMGLWGGQASVLGQDPFEAADYFYEQQQKYWEPKEQQLRTDAETRLLAQGRLGGTGGQRALTGLEEAIGANQQKRRTASFGQAQGLISQLLGRESGDLGTATGLLNIPLQQAKLGRGIGGDLGQQAASGLSARNAAASVYNQAQALTPMGSTLGQLGGLFLQPKQYAKT